MALTRTFPFDTELQLHDGATAVTADGAGQVGGAAKIIDMIGAANFTADLVIQVTALDITTGDESYEFLLQGSSSATFASDIATLGRIKLGDSTTLGSGVSADSAIGTHVAGVHNHVTQVGGVSSYRYIRVFIDVTGTTPSFTGKIYLSNIK